MKRTHNFDMSASEIVESAGATRVSGMQMPPNVKKTFVEEKSPLVSDLVRVREQTALPVPPSAPQLKPIQPPPSFQPPASPTGRIDDLQNMVAKPPLPVATPPMQSAPLAVRATELIAPKPFATEQIVAPISMGPKSSEPFASPSDRIIDLQRMATAKSVPPKSELKTVSPDNKDTWEEDMEKEVSSLLKPLQVDLRSH